MSVSYIPETVKIRLWGKAGGRCQYDGCNQPLWIDALTQAEFNSAYIAHIIADRPTGPRGDATLSEQLKTDISNLMLMCDVHHRRIDVADVDGHPVEFLRSMKERHEQRIELVTALGPDKQSHVVLYGANIGAHSAPLSLKNAAQAMLPERYPADSRPIALGMVNSSLQDRDGAYWQAEATQLRSQVSLQVKPRLAQGEVHHLSVFGLAPQPLLMLLGHLLCDIAAAEVFQLHREPPDWSWQADPNGFQYQTVEPGATDGPPALVFALSATINDERVHAVLPGANIWKMSIPAPSNDFLKSRSQARLFREKVRLLLDRIKAAHGEHATLHVFPAMPVALAVEFGRIIMPKADLKMHIYDQNQSLGGFAHALDLS
ncbi:MAG TPA: SAVED domain-containing protein [Bryobacteraceae bacterium]|nr:SAVED domain-containing protein [Bryobacteraceae bacterium]